MTELESLQSAGLNGLKPDKTGGVIHLHWKMCVILLVGREAQRYKWNKGAVHFIVHLLLNASRHCYIRFVEKGGTCSDDASFHRRPKSPSSYSSYCVFRPFLLCFQGLRCCCNSLCNRCRLTSPRPQLQRCQINVFEQVKVLPGCFKYIGFLTVQRLYFLFSSTYLLQPQSIGASFNLYRFFSHIIWFIFPVFVGHK